MFQSVEEVIERFAAQNYICNRSIATVVFLATRLEKPILVEGPAGVGKTELAKVLAGGTRLRADPPPVLRGPRRGEGALRVGVRQAAPLHADPEGQDRRAARPARHASREAVDALAAQDDVFFSRALPPAAAAAAGDPSTERRACC